MLGKNLLWVAKQHGHSVEVMLRMYACVARGSDGRRYLARIRQAMRAKTRRARRNARCIALRFPLSILQGQIARG